MAPAWELSQLMALKIAPTQTIRRNAVEKAIRERLPFLASGNLVACSIVLVPSPRYSLPPLKCFAKAGQGFLDISSRKSARASVSTRLPASAPRRFGLASFAIQVCPEPQSLRWRVHVSRFRLLS